MKFKMSEKSLFATLLRAPWWVSFLVMFGVALVAGALLPEAYKIAGMLGAFPFFVIGVIAAWRQRNALSASRIEELLEQARGMGWRRSSRVVVGRGSFSGCLAATLREYGAGALGASASINPRADDAEAIALGRTNENAENPDAKETLAPARVRRKWRRNFVNSW